MRTVPLKKDHNLTNSLSSGEFQRHKQDCSLKDLKIILFNFFNRLFSRQVWLVLFAAEQKVQAVERDLI